MLYVLIVITQQLVQLALKMLFGLTYTSTRQDTELYLIAKVIIEVPACTYQVEAD